MLSQSARATSAAESRFRVQAPNASPRAILVIAPGENGKALAESVAPAPSVSWLCGGNLADQDWRAALKGFDLALLIAKAETQDGIAALGRACRDCGVKLAAVTFGKKPVPETLRPWARTITRMVDETDLASLLEALGA